MASPEAKRGSVMLCGRQPIAVTPNACPLIAPMAENDPLFVERVFGENGVRCCPPSSGRPGKMGAYCNGFED